MRIVTEKTSFTLSIVYILCGSVISAAIFFTTDHAALGSQGAEIKELKQIQKDYQTTLKDFDHKLIKIMDKMGIEDGQ